MNAFKIPFAELPWENPRPHVQQKLMSSGNRQFRIVKFDHEFIEKDWCIKDHIGYVVSGEMHIDFDSTIKKFEPGDAIHIPHGQRHKITVISESVTLFLTEEGH